MKLAFFGDRHLSKNSPRYAHALHVWKTTIDDAIAQGATAFIGLGDVCEGQPDGVELAELAKIYAGMKKEVPTPDGLVAEVLGNHEAYSALAFLEPWGVQVAWDQIRVLILPEVAIQLIPYPRRGKSPFHHLDDDGTIAGSMKAAAAEIASAVSLERNNVARPFIVAGHFTVGGMRIGDSDFELHTTQEVVVDHKAFEGVDLAVVGHIHKAQEVAPNIVGAGSLYRCSKAEAQDPKSYVLVTVEDGKVTWERRPVQARKMWVGECQWGDIIRGEWEWQQASADDLAVPVEVEPGDEVFLTVNIDEAQLGAWDESVFDPLKAVASYFKLERVVRTQQRVRAPKLAESMSLQDEFVAWAEANQIELGGREESLDRKLAGLA